MMEKIEITGKLTTVFRKVFNNYSLVLTNELSAKDVDGWNSLSHMILITEIENVFAIRFKLKDLYKMKNVGDMIEIIMSKL
jgi:acyl carrier protein